METLQLVLMGLGVGGVVSLLAWVFLACFSRWLARQDKAVQRRMQDAVLTRRAPLDVEDSAFYRQFPSEADMQQ